MKRLLCLFLIAFTLCGCTEHKNAHSVPVKFYYLSRDPQDPSRSGLIKSQTREGYGYSGDLYRLLELYIAGPETATMSSPFPTGTRIESVNAEGSEAYITFNSIYTLLSGYQLTVANVCLAQTLFDNTELHTVHIRVMDTELDGREQITIHKDQLVYSDLMILKEE